MAARFTRGADFSGATFKKLEAVRFVHVHTKGPGLRARFLDCEVEQVRLLDVNWHRKDGRLVLLDEKDALCAGAGHEAAAVVYPQLVKNFERVRAYSEEPSRKGRP